MNENFLTPEMFSMLVNNGMGGVALILLWQVNQRLSRVINVMQDHERRISGLENKNGIVPHTHFVDV